MTGFGAELLNGTKVRRRAILKQKIAFVTMLLLRDGGAFHRENTTKRKMNQLLRD
jgi:hypothetical protein